MYPILTYSIISAFLTSFVIASGILLRKSGEPYKTGIYTLHKLSVVVIVIFVVLIYVQHFKLFSFQGIGLILFIFSSLVFINAFFTGSLLSFEKIASYKLKIVHRILSWITILFIPIIWLCCH